MYITIQFNFIYWRYLWLLGFSLKFVLKHLWHIIKCEFVWQIIIWCDIDPVLAWITYNWNLITLIWFCLSFCWWHFLFSWCKILANISTSANSKLNLGLIYKPFSWHFYIHTWNVDIVKAQQHPKFHAVQTNKTKETENEKMSY